MKALIIHSEGYIDEPASCSIYNESTYEEIVRLYLGDDFGFVYEDGIDGMSDDKIFETFLEYINDNNCGGYGMVTVFRLEKLNDKHYGTSKELVYQHMYQD